VCHRVLDGALRKQKNNKTCGKKPQRLSGTAAFCCPKKPQENLFCVRQLEIGKNCGITKLILLLCDATTFCGQNQEMKHL
jgi:hypothetical protein